MEGWKDEMNFDQRRNVNRGYRKLVVWQDAIDFYVQTCRVFRGFPFELKRVASQQITSADSVHRNIAEGYCRRSLKEYLQFLNIALSSAGESVSGLHAYRSADQISAEEFDNLDSAAYRLENRLKRLIESLQAKDGASDWLDSFIIGESNCPYVIGSDHSVSGGEDQDQRSNRAIDDLPNA